MSITAATAIVSSCSLEEIPYGFYSNGNFYKSDSDAESGLLYAYSALNYLEYLRAIWYIGDIPTETMYPKAEEPGDIHMLQNWTCTPETELTWYYFKYCYIGINRANAIIAKGEDEKAFSPEENDIVVGEGKFLRAWSYFNLVRTYGRVPITTKPIVSLDQTTNRLAENTKEIWDLIIDDLEAADSLLHVRKSFGRVDKVGAEALLSKVWLTLATSIENNVLGYRDLGWKVDDCYAKAAEYARKVVYDYNASYDFDEDLRHIYDVNAPDGPEHIFIMSTDRSGTHEGMYTKIPLQFLPDNGSIPIYIKYSDGSLQRGNGNGWGVFIVEDSFVDSFLPADKRRTELIHKTFYDANGEEIILPAGAKYYCTKYVDPDFIGYRTSARPYLLRYSDIMLVLAEAVGPTEEGYEMVNRIRQRAGIPDLESVSNVKEFRKAVINERAHELAFEGNRLFDLKRTASVTTTVPEASDLTEDQAAYYPIPQREIDLNPNVTSPYNN